MTKTTKTKRDESKRRYLTFIQNKNFEYKQKCFSN